MSSNTYYIPSNNHQQIFFDDLKVAISAGFKLDDLFEVPIAGLGDNVFLFQIRDMTNGAVAHCSTAHGAANFIKATPEDHLLIIDTFQLIKGSA